MIDSFNLHYFINTRPELIDYLTLKKIPYERDTVIYDRIGMYELPPDTGWFELDSDNHLIDILKDYNIHYGLNDAAVFIFEYSTIPDDLRLRINLLTTEIKIND